MEIIMFYGKECPHCKVMLPLANKLVKEEKIKIVKLEVWHNKKNANKMRKFKDIIIPECEGSLGVPTFLETKSKKACVNEPYCGIFSY